MHMKWPQLRKMPSTLSDEHAMRSVQHDGDHAAFGVLVDRWEAPIRRLCIRMTGDEHCGEDLTQEAFARVFASRNRFDPSRKFSTWLWRIALNLCYEETRRTTARPEQSIVDDGGIHLTECDAELGPLHHASAAERVDLVRQALSCLPETHRAVVVLREYEHLKFREIAEVLEAPEGTVKWRMTEALNLLSRQLTPILRGDGLDVAKTPRRAKEANESKERLTS